ncbi:MAG: Holliday junction resolvase RuvX [Patescibacteria group bacterium]
MRLLGIDYGNRKIGLAIGDDEIGVAAPLEVIPNEGELTIRRLGERVHSEDIDGIVVGVPLSQGGHHGPEQLEIVRNFIGRLKLQITVPVFEEDESYTTAESLRVIKESKSKIEEDAIAAAMILQGFLNK